MSGWGVYDVIIEIILNIFQGFMVTWYLQKCLGTDRECYRDILQILKVSEF